VSIVRTKSEAPDDHAIDQLTDVHAPPAGRDREDPRVNAALATAPLKILAARDRLGGH